MNNKGNSYCKIGQKWLIIEDFSLRYTHEISNSLEEFGEQMRINANIKALEVSCHDLRLLGPALLQKFCETMLKSRALIYLHLKDQSHNEDVCKVVYSNIILKSNVLIHPIIPHLDHENILQKRTARVNDLISVIFSPKLTPNFAINTRDMNILLFAWSDTKKFHTDIISETTIGKNRVSYKKFKERCYALNKRFESNRVFQEEVAIKFGIPSEIVDLILSFVPLEETRERRRSV